MKLRIDATGHILVENNRVATQSRLIYSSLFLPFAVARVSNDLLEPTDSPHRSKLVQTGIEWLGGHSKLINRPSLKWPPQFRMDSP